MNNNGNGGFWASWPAIILALFLFWPLGLFLLIRKFSVDKRAAVSAGGSGLKTLGIILIVFGSLGFIGLVSNPTPGMAGGIIVAIFFIGGGVALTLKAKKLKKEANTIKEYLSIIVNGNVRQLDTIAATINKPYDVVYNDIKNMIDKGYLKNAFINENTRAVVLPSDTVMNQTTSYGTPQNTASMQPKIVSCPCCGANNTIIGNVGECEYCGSPLK